MTSRQQDRPEPTPVVELADVGSTNVEAMTRAVAGGCGDLWILADRQTAGRGRSGREWSSPMGNLYATRLVWLDCAARVVPQLSLVIGIAAIEAIRECANGPLSSSLRLKWPNDILIASAKAGGILIESTTVGARMAVAIGIGLNLTVQPDHLDRAVTSLSAHGMQADRRSLLDALDRTLNAWLRTWDLGAGFSIVRRAWLERAGRIGEVLRVHSEHGVTEGFFAGIDDDGALLMIDSAGSQTRHAFGDVSLPGGDAP